MCAKGCQGGAHQARRHECPDDDAQVLGFIFSFEGVFNGHDEADTRACSHISY